MDQSSLTGIPLELLVHMIATYLPTKDLGALRLTSKYLETALFDTFAKEFFTKKQFMLTTPSLDALLNISRHAALVPFVKHVIIGLDRYATPLETDAHTWESMAQLEAYRNGLADQFTLESSGRGREMLAEAFRNLSNLETIGIRDYDAQGRTRENSRWRSYGAPTVFQETGIPLRESSSEYASSVYILLLQALADANRHVPSIEVILRTRGKGLIDSAFFIPSTNTNLEPVLDGLQQLLLTLDIEGCRSIIHPFVRALRPLPDSHFSNVHPFLETFLLRTSSLKHLRLNLQNHQYKGVQCVFERLSETNNLLPNLERLELGMMNIAPDLLLQTISNFSSKLRHIGLWKVQLRYSLLPRWIDTEGHFSPWPPLLRELSRMPNLHLTSIMLGYIAHIGPMEYCSRFYSFADGKSSQERAGDMKFFLPQLIDEMTIRWPSLL